MFVPNCEYSYEKTNQIMEIIYNAQTKLIVENNYDMVPILN